LDRVFGVRLGAMIFCALCAVGMFVFALGVAIGNFWVAVTGRFIFGLGGESLSVSQSTYTAKWFKGKELALAFGIALSFSRVGSAINLNIMPRLTARVGLSTAIWMGVGVCLISLFFSLFLALFDWKGTKYRLDHGLALKKKEEEKISLMDVFQFPVSLWLLVLICCTFYIGVFVFIQFGSRFFMTKWGYSLNDADSTLGIPSTFSAIASPFLGFGVDFIGMSLTWVVVACATLGGVHLFMAWTTVTPIVGMVFMGASYSVCAAALWPCVALIMPTHQLGTAYGAMTAIQNLGLAVAPLAVGAVLTKTNYNYAIVQYIYAACGGVATLLTLFLIFVDMSKGRKLNTFMPWRKKKAQESEEAAAAPPAEDEKKPLLLN